MNLITPIVYQTKSRITMQFLMDDDNKFNQKCETQIKFQIYNDFIKYT